jgi:uncharacterized protein GlcG (DUF336 family)
MTDVLRLEEAQKIAAAVRAKGAELALEPLTVAVLDRGGHLRLLEREDGSSLLRPDIATAKAWGALGMGLPTSELARRNELMPAFFTALASVSGGRVIPVPGGVLVHRDGALVGAVGVSGSTSDHDETCAVAGIEAAGFEADAAATPEVRTLDL